MKRLMTSGVAVASLLIGANIVAEEATMSSNTMKSTFWNSLHSNMIVSPAQITQMPQVKTDITIGFGAAEEKTEQNSVSNTSDTDLFGFDAAGVYKINTMPLYFGMDINYGTQSSEIGTDQKTDMTVTETVFSPKAAYMLPMGLTFAGQIDFFSQSTDFDKDIGTKVDDETYTLFTPAVMFSMANWEAGFAYQVAYEKDADSDSAAIQVPANLKLHGRYALDSTMAVGAIVEMVDQGGFDETKDMYDAQWIPRATFEMMPTQELKLEADLGYAWSYSKEDKVMNLGQGADYTPWMNTVDFTLAGDYSISEMASIGGGFNYLTGSETLTIVEGTTESKLDSTVSAWNVSIRGNMVF